MIDALAALAFPDSIPARVEEVIDGDSIKVVARLAPEIYWKPESIRILGADTPELRGRCPRERLMAVAARQRVEVLVKGQTVMLLHLDHDKWGGRYDAVVILPDGRNLADVLIAENLARAYGGEARQPWCPT